jgi:hypothetical protein
MPAHESVSELSDAGWRSVTYCEGTDHGNSDGKSVPQAPEANFAVYSGHGLAGALAGFSVGVEL